MNKLTDQSKKILQTIEEYSPVRSSELSKKLKISNKNLYKHLVRLQEHNLIYKTGHTPKVFYQLTDNSHSFVFDSFNTDDLLIEQNYIYVSPAGEIFRGLNGFKIWVEKNKFDFNKERKQYIKELKIVEKMKKNNLISAKKIIMSASGNLNLDAVFFSDLYNLAHFGKTKLGQLVYVGKSSQNKDLIQEITHTIKPSIEYLIKKYDIELICFVPPTIDRKLQFMDVLKRSLSLNLPLIKIAKAGGATKIPQKSLRKLEDRIFNAQKTIAVSPAQKIAGNVLIIDDATGSGATLNEIAKKIKKIAENKIKVIGYSVVGSYKGFDVISEV